MTLSVQPLRAYFVYCGAASAPDHISTTDTRGLRGICAVGELQKPGVLEQKRLEISRNNQRKSGSWLRIVGVVGSNPIRSTKNKSTALRCFYFLVPRAGHAPLYIHHFIFLDMIDDLFGFITCLSATYTNNFCMSLGKWNVPIE